MQGWLLGRRHGHLSASTPFSKIFVFGGQNGQRIGGVCIASCDGLFLAAQICCSFSTRRAMVVGREADRVRSGRGDLAAEDDEQQRQQRTTSDSLFFLGRCTFFISSLISSHFNFRLRHSCFSWHCGVGCLGYRTREAGHDHFLLSGTCSSLCWKHYFLGRHKSTRWEGSERGRGFCFGPTAG